MKNANQIILGLTDIHGYTHDNSAVILKNGEILFAASEERYSRIKHDANFPIDAIRSGLRFTGIKPSEITRVAVGYPPRKTLSVLKGRYFYEVVPFILNILKNRNINLLKDCYLIFKMIRQKSEKNQKQDFLKNKPIEYVDHYRAHAASSYYTSGLEKSIAITADGFGTDINGDIKSGAVFLCYDGQMDQVMSFPIYASLGLFYQSVSFALGLSANDGAGKTMGLAAYGDPNKVYKHLKKYCPSFKDGRWIPPKDWLAGLITSMPSIDYLFTSTQFGSSLDNLLKKYKKEDLAAAAQRLIEEELLNLTSYLLKQYPEYNSLTLGGGVFLNVKANKKISEMKGVGDIFIHPNAPDGGVALGAAFVATSKDHLQRVVKKLLVSAGLGESFSDSQILSSLKRYSDRIVYKKQKDISSYTVSQIQKKKVIGWFQGRAEWGPRALGYRSVLADPRDPQIKERINHVLKNREWFMPFAPSVLEEEGEKYFNRFKSTPFMTLVFDIVKGKEKLFPAAMHVDKTARANSVNLKNNQLYHKLLTIWYKRTGLPILLNTSFNRHGLPIVNSPQDAIEHLLMGAVDELIIGNYNVTKAP